MLTTLYIIRHATPDREAKIAYDVPPGPDLTEIGRAQAREAALYLSNCRLERIYTSPLQRALQTAGIVAAHCGMLQMVDDRLAEHRHGEAREDVAKRVANFIDSLDDTAASVVAFASHGSPIRASLLHLDPKIDLGKYETTVGNPTVPAGIWRATRVPSGWELEYVFEPTVGDWDRRKDNRPLTERIGEFVRRLL
jgi:broad specificity phosphatase PhoE